MQGTSDGLLIDVHWSGLERVEVGKLTATNWHQDPILYFASLPGASLKYEREMRYRYKVNTVHLWYCNSESEEFWYLSPYDTEREPKEENTMKNLSHALFSPT